MPIDFVIGKGIRMIDMPRLYGAADDDDDQPPAEQGMRGERTGPQDASQPPRTFKGEDGRDISVQATSGTADIAVGEAKSVGPA